MTARRACPSCHFRLSPLAVECPVCGLAFGQRTLPRPLLFQASALRGGAPTASGSEAAPAVRPPLPAPPQALRAPALGRVLPVQVEPEGPAEEGPAPAFPPVARPDFLPAAEDPETTSFWPLVLLEGSECLLLGLLNLVLAGLVALLSPATLSRTYQELWPYLLPLHLSVSWVLVMVPLVLTGQTLLMAPRGLHLGSEQPERRIAFSLLHLLSVAAFPLSFLCLVLTRDHRTFAELLSGQEILLKPIQRMR